MTCGHSIKVGLDAIDLYLISADLPKAVWAQGIPTIQPTIFRRLSRSTWNQSGKPMVQSLVFREREKEKRGKH